MLFRSAISGDRAFAGVAVSLDETKAIARHFDTKLNDIVLAVCAGALRRYFAKSKTALAKTMIGGVPVSLRVPGDTSQGNQVSMMLIDMATHIADPQKRVAAIIAASTKAKSMVGSMKSLIPMDLPSLGIPWLMSVITPLYRTAVASNRIPVVANVIVSNVPGPQIPLYLAGAELKTYYPVSIVTHGLGLNITIQSYAGSLYYGLIACKKTMPDLETFAGHMRAAHRELLLLLDGEKARPIGVEKKPSNVARTKPTPQRVTKAKKPAAKKPSAGKVLRVAKKPRTGAKKPTAKIADKPRVKPPATRKKRA